MRITGMTFGALALAALTCTSAAQSRPDTQRMTCNEARSVVLRHGAIVMTTGPGTYERIVSTERFCLLGEAAMLAQARTRDRAYCTVGYYCGQNSDYSPF